MQLDEDILTRQAPPPLRFAPEDFYRDEDVEESSESEQSSASETSSESSNSSGSGSSSSSQFSKSGFSSSSITSRTKRNHKQPHRHHMMFMQTSDVDSNPIGSSVAPGNHFGFIKNVSRDLNGTTGVIVIRRGRRDDAGIIDANTKIHLPNSLGTIDDIWPNQTISFHMNSQNVISDLTIIAGHWHGLIEDVTDNPDGTQTLSGAVHPQDKKKS
jgi:hypothetical protein